MNEEPVKTGHAIISIEFKEYQDFLDFEETIKDWVAWRGRKKGTGWSVTDITTEREL